MREGTRGKGRRRFHRHLAIGKGAGEIARAGVNSFIMFSPSVT
jgi:hypothetical protein